MVQKVQRENVWGVHRAVLDHLHGATNLLIAKPAGFL